MMNVLRYCDVLKQERATIMVLDKPDHPFWKSLVEIARSEGG